MDFRKTLESISPRKPPQLDSLPYEKRLMPEYMAKAKRAMPNISCMMPLSFSCFGLALAIMVRVKSFLKFA